MRIYVAAKFEEKPAAQALQNALRERGHVITYDWTVNEDASAHLPMCAYEDIRGVVTADAVVLIWHPNLKGGLVELGAALALEKCVVVVGCPKDQPCIFFHHDEIAHVESLDYPELSELEMILASGTGRVCGDE